MKVFGTDYDGVIINIEPQKAKAFGSILNKQWGTDINEAAIFWLASGGTSRKYKFEYLYSKKYGEKLSDTDYIEIESKYSNLLKNEFYPQVKLLPGAKNLLEFVKVNFDKTFISSGIPAEELQYLAELNKVAKWFDLCLGTGDKYPSKKEHFDEVRLRWNPSEMYFVADSAEDMKEAKKAGAYAIGVLTNHKGEDLIESGADQVCQLQDTIPVLKDLIR